MASIKTEPIETSPYFNENLSNFSWRNFIDFKSSQLNSDSSEPTDLSVKREVLDEKDNSSNSFKRKSDSDSKEISKKKSKVKTNTQQKSDTTERSGNAPLTETFKAKKKKIDRFNGATEEEVLTKFLPDHLAESLDILIVGINPGLVAAHVGHHYAGPGNHFWQCMYLSGLIPSPMTAYDDFKLLELGIGFTNMVARTTRSSADLTRKELKEGADILRKKLQQYKPKIAVFNGKVIYEAFSGKKDFFFGKQEDPIEGTATIAFVMPSSSARCAQLPRASDKVPYYQGLRKLRDFVLGKLAQLETLDVVFPKLALKVKTEEDASAVVPKTEATAEMAPSRANRRKNPSPMQVKQEPEEGGTGPEDLSYPRQMGAHAIPQPHLSLACGLPPPTWLLPPGPVPNNTTTPTATTTAVIAPTGGGPKCEAEDLSFTALPIGVQTT